jgi:hypothetical protein
MRLVTFDMGSGADPSTNASSGRVEDIRLAVAILAGAVSVADAEMASSTRAATKKIIRACRAFEAAVAAPPAPAVNMAHMPSAATLKTIAVVEAVRASMRSAATRATIATVEAAQHAVSRQLKG